MNLKNKILGLYVGMCLGVISGLTGCGDPFHPQEIVERRRDLAMQVRERAAGEDKILSKEEAINMFRDLGYEGVISETGPFDFYHNYMHGDFRMVIGERQIIISEERVRQYLDK